MQSIHWPKLGAVALAAGLPLSAVGTPSNHDAVGTPSNHIGDRPTTLRALYHLRAPTALRAAQTAVVLVDFQKEFVDGRLPLPGSRSAIARARELATWARQSGVLVVMVRNVVRRPSSPLFAPESSTTAFVPELQPDARDLVVEKSMVGAFSHTTLDALLRARGVDTLIVGGFMTHLAVQSTATDGTVLGYRVVVAADATGTRSLPGVGGEAGVDAKLLERAALASIADRVADVMLTRDVIALPVTR